MIDSTENGAVVTYLCEHVQAFTEPLSDLLRKYSGQRRRNVIVIPEGGVVTLAFDRLTAVAGAIVLVQELGAGFRDLRSGRWFKSVSAALRTDRDQQALPDDTRRRRRRLDLSSCTHRHVIRQSRRAHHRASSSRSHAVLGRL